MRILDGGCAENSTLKILYLTPGQLSVRQTHRSMCVRSLEKIAKSKTMMAKLQKLYDTKQFTRLIVDEVHCVSQYGHDFRPGEMQALEARKSTRFCLDYKYLSIFKRQFPKVSILGLTATATMKVIDDVRQILSIPRCVLFRAPFNRKNLVYEVLHKPEAGRDALHELVHCIRRRFDQQSGECMAVPRGCMWN